MEGLPRRFGPFVLLDRLGKGASGAIYLARTADRGPSQIGQMVIKLLHPQLAQDPVIVQRFRHEAAIAVHVDSPYLARVHALGTVDGQLYIAMAYVEGAPLSQILEHARRRDHRLDVAVALDIIVDGLHGLSALHGAVDPADGSTIGFIHRDVAPKNIIRGADGVTKLIDLGIGKSNMQEWKTATGLVVGSPGYMAPEQVRAADVDHRVDVFAMGVVLFELLTTERFIKRAPLAAMLRASLNPPLRPIGRYRDDAPPEIDDILQRALAVDPAQRFGSARAFREALESVRSRIPSAGDSLLDSIVEELAGGSATDPTAVIPSDSAIDDRQDVTVTFAMSEPFLADTVAVEPDERPSIRRGGLALAAALVAAFAAALTIGITSREAPEVPLRVPTPKVSATPKVRARPAAPAAAPDPAPPAAETPATKRPKRIRRTRAEPKPPTPPPRELEPPNVRLRTRARRLLDRAKALRARVPALAPSVDVLVGDIARERMSTNPEAALGRLDAIEAKLTRLEQQTKRNGS